MQAGQGSAAVLLTVQAAEIRRVSGKGLHQQVVGQGAFTISAVDKPAPQQQRQGSASPAAQHAARPPAPAPAVPAQPTRQLRKGTPDGQYDSDSSEGGDSGSCSIVASVGSFSWELLPASQTLKVGELTFVFSTDQQDSFLLVTLAMNTDAEAVGMLEAILESCTTFRESTTLLADPRAQAGEVALAEHAYKSSLAQGVEGMSKRLATGLLASAAYAANSITKSAAKLTPAEPTATPVAVSPKLKKRLRQTERMAGFTAKAVHGAVSGLAWMGAKVAGGVLRLAGANKPLKPGEEAGTLREMAQASVLGFGEVWDAMESAGKVVLLSSRDGVSDVLRFRYGDDAAEASVSSMNAAGHSADALYAVRKIGVKTVAKAAAKTTAKGVLHQWAGLEGGQVKTSSTPAPLPATPTAPGP